MDVDLQIFLPIPYNTTQAGIGGDLWRFLHSLFIPYTTKNLKTAKQNRRDFLLVCPPRTTCGFAKREREFLSIPFARHNTGDFSKCQKWAQKNRKPFLDSLFRCAAIVQRAIQFSCPDNGGSFVIMILSG